MIEPMKEMAGFIVMVFPLAQFVAMFNWSNMGKFIAVVLTDILESSGLSGIPAFVDDAGRQLPDAAKPVAKPAGLQFGRHRAAALIVPDRADHMHLRRIRAGNQPGALEEMIGEIGRRAAEGIFVRHDIVVVKHLAQSDGYDLVRIPHTSRRFIPVPSPCRPCGP